MKPVAEELPTRLGNLNLSYIQVDSSEGHYSRRMLEVFRERADSILNSSPFLQQSPVARLKILKQCEQQPIFKNHRDPGLHFLGRRGCKRFKKE